MLIDFRQRGSIALDTQKWGRSVVLYTRRHEGFGSVWDGDVLRPFAEKDDGLPYSVYALQFDPDQKYEVVVRTWASHFNQLVRVEPTILQIHKKFLIVNTKGQDLIRCNLDYDPKAVPTFDNKAVTVYDRILNS